MWSVVSESCAVPCELEASAECRVPKRQLVRRRLSCPRVLPVALSPSTTNYRMRDARCESHVRVSPATVNPLATFPNDQKHFRELDGFSSARLLEFRVVWIENQPNVKREWQKIIIERKLECYYENYDSNLMIITRMREVRYRLRHSQATPHAQHLHSSSR